MYSYYSDRGECARCSLSCAQCWGPRRDQCVACPQGWQLAAGECHPECPEGFFKAEYGCQKCHHYCRTCKGMFNITSQCNIMSDTMFVSFRWRTSAVYLLPSTLHAGRWSMHGVSYLVPILWSSHRTLQAMS